MNKKEKTIIKQVFTWILVPCVLFLILMAIFPGNASSSTKNQDEAKCRDLYSFGPTKQELKWCMARMKNIRELNELRDEIRKLREDMRKSNEKILEEIQELTPSEDIQEITMAKKNKQPEESTEIQIPYAYTDNILNHMEHNAKNWEEIGNILMVNGIRRQMKGRQEKQHEFLLANELEIPSIIVDIKPQIEIVVEVEEVVKFDAKPRLRHRDRIRLQEEAEAKEKAQPKSKKKHGGPTLKQHHGDTKPELIEKAIEALTSPHEGELIDNDTFVAGRIGDTPTSVELFDDYARVWFEYFEEDAPRDAIVKEWGYYLCVPAYHFWGKKKREKYLRASRESRTSVNSISTSSDDTNGPTPGWEGKLKITDFLITAKENVIIMPACYDHSRIIIHNTNSKTDFDQSYTVFSGSRYGEDRATHAYVYKTKEGFDFMLETLNFWYSSK